MEGLILTRSRSDSQIKKSLVWSPTPVREINVNFLENLNSSPNSSFASTENPLVIRKFQSAGLIGMNHNFFDSFDESPEARNVERNLFGADFCDQDFSSSSYPSSEMPVRSSNPLARDVKFRETDSRSDANAFGPSNVELLFLSQN